MSQTRHSYPRPGLLNNGLLRKVKQLFCNLQTEKYCLRKCLRKKAPEKLVAISGALFMSKVLQFSRVGEGQRRE